MANKDKTLYQRLGGLFGNSGLKINNPTINKYSIADTELIRTTNKSEFEAVKKQELQNAYLKNQWQRVENEMFQKSIQHEATRVGSYSDFEAMEFYPEIAAALDLISEESCLHPDTKIKLLNGEVHSIKEMYDTGMENFWVYAVDIKDNKVKPANIEKVVHRGVKEIFKITLDNGSEVICTSDHKWLSYDSVWVETKDLITNTLLKVISESLLSSVGVISVEHIGASDVYDLLNSTVDSNFAVKCDDDSMLISHNCTLNDKGRILNIYSDSERVKGILDDLFFNRLDIHTVLHMWVRNTVKYGDNFVFLNINDKLGITGARQMPNYEMERREVELSQMIRNMNTKSSEDNTVKFLWRGKNIEFNAWQIAHFRLLGDDRKLPYGSSILEKCRKIWKELVLTEDAMMVYRITRAPERRVFKVYVGNLDDEDVPAYINQIANRFKRTPVIDPQTGQVDLKYNQYAYDQDYIIPVRTENAPNPIDTLPGACISLDTRIPLLDGRTLELNEIISEWENGNRDLWVYSCDPITGKLAPGMITWAGETRKNTDVIKITLDNGESLITTPDHKWVHRTNGFVEAKDLVVGDSLMKFSLWECDDNNITTNMVWDASCEMWVSDTDFDTSNGKRGFIADIRISSIEWLTEKQDTGTITVDGDEVHHNYHTFATESGVFIKNSNLSDIGDIEYLQRKLFTALRVPKSFLGFDDAQGDGKNLALQDIRFTRTINRIQQAIIMELNKMAIIHLYLLGFEDELDNFTITMNNPSTQAEMLKIEHWNNRVSLYQEAVRDSGNGFAAMSMTRAKRDILGMSNDEIKQDLLEQRMEKAAAAELEQTSTVIKKTGFFDKVDNIYGIPMDERQAPEDGDATDGGDTSKSGFGGGGGFGGDEIDFDGADTAEDTTSETDKPEDTTKDETNDTGAEDFGGDAEEFGGKQESFIRKTNKILTERNIILQKRLEERKKRFAVPYMDRLVNSVTINENVSMNPKFDNKNLKLNDDIDSMISQIDKLTKQ